MAEERSKVDVSYLRRLREQAVLSQQQLADKSGVARDTISKLETGQRRAYPTTIQKLAASLGVEPRELVGENAAQDRPEGPKQEEGHEGEPRKKMGFR